MTLPGYTSNHRPASRRAVLGRGLGLLAVAAVAPLAACSSDPAFYTLAPWPGPAQGGAPAVIEVRTPTVALSLDRDRIVGSDGDYRIKLSSGDAWSESLPTMIAHVLTANLQQRLPGSAVFAQNDSAAGTPLAVVELDVTRFARDGAGRAVLAGSLAVHPVGVPGSSSVLGLTLPVQGGGTPGMVAALSGLLGQVADEAAVRLRTLGAGLKTLP
ncbi:hypothetical protein AA13595_1862 [Gluconacetobacter johannae DSM 13595]|uniref:Membrane integrity-associated transporter subunit PqiC n=1 Tax=Gluconacetobacter johannae TaxID=112140 RepID=A0A7W4J9D1_9PROT|nr:PqiC family protein [Gluconacetobacter johannae]MBB2176882.1 membrane integrity-associated transporter subunit PqiC [Gluconacetobacter johannae]GBQ86295.1 hypothetical protein AA13595_1862 [Gluconacetobacter johannae DSM 13595]